MSKPLQLIRHYATPTATPSSSRLVASLILSRSPLTLPPLKPFEAAYYKYANTVQTAQADDFDQSFYFRKGSQAEKSFLNAQSASPAEANEVVEGASMQDLNRLSDRTLYLLLKKKGRTRENGLWQFRRSIFPQLFYFHDLLGPLYVSRSALSAPWSACITMLFHRPSLCR